MTDGLQPAQHFIGGRFVDSQSGATFEHVDPATEEITGSVARGDAADVDLAVRSARAAFEGGEWSRATAAKRREVLFKVADLIEARSQEIATVQTLEMGGPIGGPIPGPPGSPHPGIARAALNFRFFAEEQEVAGDQAFNQDGALLTYTIADPAGVFALITPWNAPFMLATWKIAPCLAYGNTTVHKPSELSPYTVRILCEIFQEAGLPDGTYNMVLGYGQEVGAPLVAHPDVVGVSFTGSLRTATDIGERVAPQLKRTSFELGGKSAMIVFADADLDRAVPAAAVSVFNNSGQVCAAGSRILVQRDVYDEFLTRFEAEAGKWKIGPPTDPTTRLGPLVSRGQYEKVLAYLDLAREEGRILFGGGRPEGLDRGFYVEPAVVVDVDPGDRICQEEIFGPVAVVMPFDTADDAIKIANHSSYGLAGYVWTDSQRTAHYVAQQMDTGMVWINIPYTRDLRQPFGGMKTSGLGREGGGHSREFFTDTRFVAFPLT